MSPQKHCANRGLRGQRGVGLIEVMIAVVVLAIGLLGLAAMQVRTLRDNESSSERGIAVVQTHSIIDAMRADRTNAVNGVFNIALTASAPAGSTFRDVTIAGWRTNLTAMLGANATGAIACNGSACTVTVQWDDSRGSGGSQTFSVQTEVQL
jgi:type IV pilus assembly protein PilV